MKILITGTTSGIGKQLALDYLRDGHTVYCCGRNQSALKAFSGQFPALAQTLSFDIQSRDDCLQALTGLPQLDLAILNAGTCEYINAREFDAASFERVVRTNLIGMANCLQYIIPNIAKGGCLSLMGSSSSYLPLPRAEAYGASKAATEYLARTLAISLKQQIKVSYIAPGFVETPLTDLNDFPMPMRVDVKFASASIRRGIARGKSEIHFPKLFTGMLKTLRLLPFALQKRLLARTLAPE
ncbi:MAG: SDR family NAD(P)-dependent oxidoreductase [Gammaproteobacteria bacterium]|nr:SDR family NAD(P)-dependent oxidoreductase [Gammaproteobacteria bacterium]MCY4357902.1 SDR family NAD(P)-dependent oxidoreductase [Gammaproteobacteria bacterium]